MIVTSRVILIYDLLGHITRAEDLSFFHLYHQKNPIIDTFHLHRILNPITHKKLSEKSVFPQKINIYSDSIQANMIFVVTKIQANMIFVVTKWRQTVTWKSGCFSAPERGDFLKNSGILQFTKIGLF
jgi:hypothetical protein